MEDREPTHRQHLILKKVEEESGIYRDGDEEDIELIWELVREGYLKNLVLLGGSYEWKFKLTLKGEAYLGTVK